MNARHQVGQQAARLAESDGWRAIVMATVTSLFPVLQVLGVVSLTADQIATVTVFVGNLTLLLAYFLPKREAAPPDVPPEHRGNRRG